MILSDHGQIDVTRTLHLNSIFVERGFIQLRNNGEVSEWKAWASSCGTSCQIVLNDSENEYLTKEVHSLLLELMADKSMGIGEVLTAEVLGKRFGLCGPFSFMVDTDGTTAFSDNIVKSQEVVSTHTHPRGSHGHLPHFGSQPTFLAKGPAFKSGVEIIRADIVDVAPTIASVFDLSLIDSCGRPVQAILAN